MSTNRKDLKYLDGHDFKEVLPVPEKNVQTCINNNFRRTNVCETVKSLNISMKLDTDIEILQSGIATASYLQHQLTRHRAAIMEKQSAVINQLY